MAIPTIHEIDPAVEQCLRHRAARHGHSIEEEIRHILQNVVGGHRGPTEERLRSHAPPLPPFEGVVLGLPQIKTMRKQFNLQVFAVCENG
jgi:plasmid stability protein